MLAVVAMTCIACFLASLLGTELVRRIAIRRALLDTVNERSLHTVPTPRLGGVAIVLTSLAAELVAWTTGTFQTHVLVVVCAVLALLGLRDDLRPMSAAIRLGVQTALAIAFILVVGVPPFLIAKGVALPVPPAVAGTLLVIWIVALLNIYNFMDGMDGLAGSQAVSAGITIGVLFGSVAAGPSVIAFAVGGAALGFLAHNLPPARIFMGDAGSTFLGMTFATLSILGLFEGIPITQSALPLAPFLLDGTFTIIRRALKKERIWTAHRSHLYQRAVQTGLDHRDVLLVYLAWIAVAAGGSLLGSFGMSGLAVGWACALIGLVAVWGWVTRRESDRRDLA